MVMVMLCVFHNYLTFFNSAVFEYTLLVSDTRNFKFDRTCSGFLHVRIFSNVSNSTLSLHMIDKCLSPEYVDQIFVS